MSIQGAPPEGDRTGGPDGPEPATQSQPKALIPCADERALRLLSAEWAKEPSLPVNWPKWLLNGKLKPTPETNAALRAIVRALQDRAENNR
jgi:hypothetical protein